MARLSKQAKPWSSRSAQRVGLTRKAGLVALTGDDRAVLYGAVLTPAMGLQGEDREHGPSGGGAGSGRSRPTTRLAARPA